MPGSGGGTAFADLVVADPRLVGPVPAEVATAAALALVRGGLLALSTLRAARFEPGGSVLVTAAASGTGHLAGCYWWAWRQKSSCQAGVPGLVTPTWVSRMATVSVAGTRCAAVPVPPVHP
jgi:hypothetical protein